jgi:hypothetical protein
MSLALLFSIGAVVFVITMTGAFLFGLTQFEHWQQRDDEASRRADPPA